MDLLRSVILAVYPVMVLLLAIILEKYIVRKTSRDNGQIQRFVTWMLISILLLFYILVNSKYSTVVDVLI
jgi:hypothetical protein